MTHDNLIVPTEDSVWTVEHKGKYTSPADHDCFEGLPDNHDEDILDWWLATEDPCMAGDDMWLAVDEAKEIGYFTFDGYCAAYHWSGSLEEWADTVCGLDGPIDDLGLKAVE